MIRKIIFILFLLCCTSTAQATDYYVSTTGNNSNPGTQESPFLTISYAIDYAHSNDTIFITSGTYTEQVKFSNSIEPRLTLIGVGETKPIITYNNGGGTVEFGTSGYNTPNATGHIIKNLDIRNTGNTSFDVGKGIVCSYNSNTSNILVENCSVHTIRRGIHVSFGAHNNITIRNCDIHTEMGDAIKCEPTGTSTVNIINNDIWAAEHGYYSTTSSGISLVSDYNTVNVSDNRIWYAGYTGIKPVVGTGLFSNNTIYSNGYAHNAFENAFINAVIRNCSVIGHNNTQQMGGSRSANVFYSAGGIDSWNLSCYDFYSNDTMYVLASVGGHQHDFYIDNFTANNHNGMGFRIFGYSDQNFPVERYSSNNIVFKNCTFNASFVGSSAAPVQVVCLGTNTSSNPSPYLIQNTTGWTRDKVAYVNLKLGGNYNIGYHDFWITDNAAGPANKHHHGDIKVINPNHADDYYFEVVNPSNWTTTLENMYYADVVLQDGSGNKLQDKTVTFATTSTNPETLTTISPVNINASSGQKSYVDTLSETTTDANGRTPLPSNISHTIAITDFLKWKNGTNYLNWSIDADGVVLDNVNPDSRWYRDNQDQSNYTIIIIKNDTTNTHLTGYAPSPDYNHYNIGDLVKFQIWASEPLTSIAWKKDGVTAQTGGMTFETVIDQAPVTVDVTGVGAGGTVTKTWIVDPTQVIIDPEPEPDPEPDNTSYPPVANFTSNVTSGTKPLRVQFNDTSENATAWYWDFDNNGIVDSTVQNPIRKFNTPGNYTVKLTVSNEDGMDYETKENYITVIKTGTLTYIWSWFSNILSFLLLEVING